MTTTQPDWYAADRAYQLHHTGCATCKAAGANPSAPLGQSHHARSDLRACGAPAGHQRSGCAGRGHNAELT